MAVASLGPYSGSVHHNLMQLMRNGQSSNTDSLVSMLAAGSCSSSPMMIGLQQGLGTMGGGGLEDVSTGGLGRQSKRPYYGVTYDEPSVEEPEDGEEFSPHVEKKRRVSFDQVRSLERSFELENKLEPERKMLLAKELGLQPRQVAVWFQNRRARWKIKQLERDYEALNHDYNRLLADMDAVTRDKTTLKAEVNRLKGITSTEDDAKPVESAQCRSDTLVDSPVQSERSDIDHHLSRTAPNIDVVPKAIAKELSADVQERIPSSEGCNSSDVVDADSPCTSDSSRSSLPNRTQPGRTQSQQPTDAAGHPWAQYPLESFVGPNSMQDGVKIEDMDQAFLLSRLEDQPVLPNWWDWA